MQDKSEYRPGSTSIDFMIWRVADSTLCSGIQEIDNHYTIVDLFEAHEYLDIKEEAQAYERKRLDTESKRGR